MLIILLPLIVIQRLPSTQDGGGRVTRTPTTLESKARGGGGGGRLRRSVLCIIYRSAGGLNKKIRTAIYFNNPCAGSAAAVYIAVFASVVRLLFSGPCFRRFFLFFSGVTREDGNKTRREATRSKHFAYWYDTAPQGLVQAALSHQHSDYGADIRRSILPALSR